MSTSCLLEPKHSFHLYHVFFFCQVFYLIFCRSVWHFPLRLDSQLYVEVVFNQIAPDYLEGLLLIMPGEQLDQDAIVSCWCFSVSITTQVIFLLWLNMCMTDVGIVLYNGSSLFLPHHTRIPICNYASIVFMLFNSCSSQ